MPRADRAFIARSEAALGDVTLRAALHKAETGFVKRRQQAIDELDETTFAAMCDAACLARQKGLDNLAEYLQTFEHNATANGSQVHWASDAEACNQIVLDILSRDNCREVGKGKSMVAEETGLNHRLDAAGIERTETDLGEYIVQLANEPPSHIIAPAVHKSRAQIKQLFITAHDLPPGRPLSSVAKLVGEARSQLRSRFYTAQAGIIGSNLLVAQTGASLLVTNEGNGDLSASLPRVLIIIAGIEKVVADMPDAFALLRVLGRSATGQPITAYTSFYNGPRRKGETDGPEQVHFVLLDNGRSRMLAEGFGEMLRCIRCGACLNHCPVYGAIGGHAYGAVYPGPMGAVLSPLLLGLHDHAPLPNASTFCGRCEQVCPMRIPLTGLMRQLRNRQFAQGGGAARLVRMHAWLTSKPRLYGLCTRLAARRLHWLGKQGTLPAWLLPRAWRARRAIPASQGKTLAELAKEL